MTNYQEIHIKLIDAAIKEASEVLSNIDVEKHMAKANMFANVAMAIASAPTTECSCDIEKEETEKPQTKRGSRKTTKKDLQPQPTTVTESKVDEEETVPEAVADEPETTVEGADQEVSEDDAEFVNVCKQIMAWMDNEDNEFGITSDLITFWCSQVIGEEVSGPEAINDHPEKVEEFTAYFAKIAFIVNNYNVNIDTIADALGYATNGMRTTIQEMSPDNIDLLLATFEQAESESE